jgi:hypothetical protein
MKHTGFSSTRGFWAHRRARILVIVTRIDAQHTDYTRTNI